MCRGLLAHFLSYKCSFSYCIEAEQTWNYYNYNYSIFSQEKITKFNTYIYVRAYHTWESQRPHRLERFRDRKGTQVYETFWARNETRCLGGLKGSLQNDKIWNYWNGVSKTPLTTYSSTLHSQTLVPHPPTCQWFLNFNTNNNPQEALLETRSPGPTLRVSESVFLKWGSKICMSDKLPCDPKAVYSGTKHISDYNFKKNGYGRKRDLEIGRI